MKTSCYKLKSEYFVGVHDDYDIQVLNFVNLLVRLRYDLKMRYSELLRSWASEIMGIYNNKYIPAL